MNSKTSLAWVLSILGFWMTVLAPIAGAGTDQSSRFESNQYTSGPWVFKLTSPTGIAGSRNPPQIGRIRSENASKPLNDTEAAATYNLYTGSSSSPEIDITGKVKVNLGDKSRQFGFTQNDYAAQMDVYQSMDKFTAKGSLGSTVLGSPAGIILNPRFYGSFGGVYQFSDQASSGVDMNLSQDPSYTGGVQPELSAYISYKLDKNFKARGYVLRGVSNGNLNNAVGGQVYYGF
jgi:hypothetical protein